MSENLTYRRIIEMAKTPSAMAGDAYLVLFSADGTETRTSLPGSDPFRLTTDEITTTLLSYTGPLATGLGGAIRPGGSGYPRVYFDLMHPLPADVLGARLSATGVLELPRYDREPEIKTECDPKTSVSRVLHSA